MQMDWSSHSPHLVIRIAKESAHRAQSLRFLVARCRGLGQQRFEIDVLRPPPIGLLRRFRIEKQRGAFERVAEEVRLVPLVQLVWGRKRAAQFPRARFFCV